MGDAGELAVLAFEEDTGVQEDFQKEPCLTVREAKRRDGVKPIGVRQLERPAERLRRKFNGLRRDAHRNSSMIRGLRPPLPPPRPPTLDPRER